MRRARPILRILLLPALLLVSDLARADTADLEKVRKAALKTISAMRGREHILFLAGPKCEGRASGETGCNVAAEYIVGVLKEHGLEPAGDGDTYRQTFQVPAGPFPGQRPRQGRPTGMQPTSNLVAILPGSDPKLAGEYIVLGAHYDHIGYRDLRKGKVYWGADDNASGTTAVLLVAEAFAEGELRPRRSLMFLLFSGEERGLLGSKHFVSRPTRPLSGLVAVINLDMVGRNDSGRMFVYGSASSPELSEANLRLGPEAKFRFSLEDGSIFMRSDHYPFYQRNLPVLFITSGLHGDLHDLDDEPKKINFGKVERAAEHAYRLLWEIGDRDAKPTFNELPPSGAAGILGFLPATLAASEIRELSIGRKRGAVAVSEVESGSPAEKAGVEAGDLVFGLAGKYLKDDDPLGDLDEIADDLKPGGRYPLLVLRDRRPKTLAITLNQ